ncbi:hypothetical protein AHF37_03874, partial [Paragonimus kellicotti]
YSIVFELLSSLDLLFVNYARTHTGPDRDVQVSAILDVLFGSKETSVQFQTAVCELPNFPTELAHVPPDACAFFAKYQQSVRKLCTCGRENLLQEMKLYSSSLNSSRLLRCPQLARYQCWILDHLNEQLHNWISLNASDFTIDFDLYKRQACEKICFQLNTNPEDFLASLSSMAEMLVELLSPSGVGSFRDKTNHSLLDDPTQKAGFRCLSSVQRLVAHFRLVMYNVLSPTNSAFKESYSVGSMDSSDLDPSVSRIWKCILGTAHLASIVNSPIAPVACRVLRQLFTNCGPSLDSVIPESDEISATSLLSTLFYPYLQARQLKRRTDTQHTKRLTSLCEQLSRLSEPEFVQCITKRLEQFIATCPASDHVHAASRDWISSFILWLLDVNPAYNEIYMYIKPLFPLSFELSKHLFPWLVVHTLQSTLASLPHALSTCISACLSQSSTSPLIQHLWIDSLLAYHAWEQWRRVQCPRLTQPLNLVSTWLSAAERALDLMRPHGARLFLELAWLADDYPSAWLTRQLRTRRIWLGICRLFNDLAGLRAAQAAFLFPCTSAPSPSLSSNVVNGEENNSFPQDLHPMLDETNTNLMSEVNTLTPIMRMGHRPLSNSSHQISWFTRISEIANQLTPSKFSTMPDTALRIGYLSLLNEAVSFVYLMASPGWSFVGGSASQNTAATLVESVEPFVTGTLRLASSLAAQFTTTNLDERLVARSLYLVTQCYLRAASAATDICQLTVADDWLQNADQCQRVIARFLSDRSELKPGLYAYQAWQQLSSILSASCLQRLKGEPRLAASHLQAGLAAAELTIGQLHQDTGPMIRRGLINFYVHSITVLCDWLFDLRTKSAADLLTNYLVPIYRFISLWLSSAAEPSAQSNSDTRKRNVNRLMSERVPCIRADKFLPLTPQLAVRLSLNRPGSDQDFQSTLFELIVRIVDWHPHHAAFTLLFLVNAELDNLYDPKTAIAQHPAVLPPRSRQTRLTSGSRKLSSSENPQSFTDQNQRIQAARRVLTRLIEGRRGPLLRQMQSLAEAYVELANADVCLSTSALANSTYASARDCI